MDRIKETQALQAHAQKAWDKFTELYPRLIRFKCPKIILNGRYTKHAGMCYMLKAEIQISLKYYIFNKKHIIKNTLIHELAHQVDFHLNGLENMQALQGHGPTWCNIMVEYGLEPDRYHTLAIPNNMKLYEMMAL